jgi:hypothetical protein
MRWAVILAWSTKGGLVECQSSSAATMANQKQERQPDQPVATSPPSPTNFSTKDRLASLPWCHQSSQPRPRSSGRHTASLRPRPSKSIGSSTENHRQNLKAGRHPHEKASSSSTGPDKKGKNRLARLGSRDGSDGTLQRAHHDTWGVARRPSRSLLPCGSSHGTRDW